MKSLIAHFRSDLFSESNAKGIILFRVLFGIVLFAQTIWFIQSGFVQESFVDSKIHVPFFTFLQPLPEQGMKFILLVMLISSVGIVLAKMYRISVITFLVSFTYLWLLDKSYFNNHYYFMSLMVFLMLFITPKQDVKGTFNLKGTVPYWQLFILKAQVFIVFIIAGIHKLNYYWIVEFQPMKHILETKAQVSNMDFLNTDFMFAFFSWTGLLFDLSIGFLLWYSKTRRFGLFFFVIFNLLNFWLFYNIGEIGFFPFALMACLPLFFYAKIEDKKSTQAKNTPNKMILGLITLFLVIQILLPFRYLLFKDHVDWTGNGQRFAWRMKIMYKEVDMHFYLVEEGSESKLEVNVGNFLNSKQYTNLMYFPDFILPVANYIKEEGEKRGLINPKVVTDFNVGFMGHTMQPLINPKLNLASKKMQLSGIEAFILPMKDLPISTK